MLQLSRQGAQPLFIDEMHVEALGIVKFGEVFGDGEFFGDITDNRGVIEPVDNPSLQGLGDIWPGKNSKFQIPGFIGVDIDRRLGDTEIDPFCLFQGGYRPSGGPAVTAITGKVDDLKDLFAKAFDIVEQSCPADDGTVETARQRKVRDAALHEIQTAQMWAVKAATWGS